MISPFKLYNIFCAEVNTYQGGFFRPERDFINAVNRISYDLWDRWTAQAEKSQEITDELAPFTKSVNIIVQQTKQAFNLLKYPIDYARFSSARILLHENETIEDCNCETWDGEKYCERAETEEQKQERINKYKDGIVESQVYKIDNSRWSAILTHRNKRPTFEDPAMTQVDSGFKVAPHDVSVIVLDYFVKPREATFVYTNAPGNVDTGAGDYLIYNENASVKLQWNETMIPYFIDELRKVYSRYTRDGILYQMSVKQ